MPTPSVLRAGFRYFAQLTRRSPLILRLTATLLVGRPLISLAADPDQSADALALTPAPFNHTHEWLIYVALGLGALNMVLLYLLNRSPRPQPAQADGSEASEGSSASTTRTDLRMDKRKREIDSLRQSVEGLTGQITAEAAKHLTPAQIQELVRTFVQDELKRTALPGSPPSR